MEAGLEFFPTLVNLSSTTAAERNSLNVAIIKNLITVIFCVSINYVNCVLVHIFRKNQLFHMNPRYILYVHLVVNDILLLTMFTLLNVLSYIVYTLNVCLCAVLLISAIFANLNNPLTLSIMAIECYIAVCFPLQHAQICTVKKTYVVLILIWATSALTVLPDLFVILATKPLEFFYSRIFCMRQTLFDAPNLEEKRDISYIVLMVVIWLTLVYSYVRILCAAQAATADVKKARNTVLLHGFQLLLCMLTYIYHILQQGLIYLFPKYILIIRFTTTILVQVLPRLISPVVYGLRDKTFRKYLRKYLFYIKIDESGLKRTQEPL